MMMGAFPLGVGALGSWSTPGRPVGEEPFPGGRGRLGMAGGCFPSWGFPILSLFRLLGAIQQRVLTGSQARGTGRSFPAFGLRLLQGEGGTGESRAVGLGCEGGEVPTLPLGGSGRVWLGALPGAAWPGHLVPVVLGLVFGGA